MDSAVFTDLRDLFGGRETSPVADPYSVYRRLRRDAPLNTPDRATFYGGDGRGYVDYPSLEDPA